MPLPLEPEIRDVIRNAAHPAQFDAAIERLKQQCEAMEPGTVKVLAMATGSSAADYVQLGRTGMKLVSEAVDLFRKITGAKQLSSSQSPPPSSGPLLPQAGPEGPVGT